MESLKTYYEKQSSGRYSVDGMVTDWVKVKYNEARYGRPFDGVVDGIVYAGMAGIGFAFVENILYLGRSFLEAGGGAPEAVLRARCEAGFGRRGMARDPGTLARLEDELGVIRGLGYPSYFLTVADVSDDLGKVQK